MLLGSTKLYYNQYLPQDQANMWLMMQFDYSNQFAWEINILSFKILLHGLNLLAPLLRILLSLEICYWKTKFLLTGLNLPCQQIQHDYPLEICQHQLKHIKNNWQNTNSKIAHFRFLLVCLSICH